MVKRIDIDTPNGRIGAWQAMPEGKPRDGIVLIQEIFGVNAHIRSVADRFAAHGYAVIAPALFDPAERDVELDYDAAGIARGRELAAAIGFDTALDSIDAAAKVLQGILESPHTDVRALARDSHIAAIGYCWGGSLAFLANTRLGLTAVSYYGARTVPFAHETAHAPLLFHFGERDTSIPAADIATIRAAQPDAEAHVWPAGHGFNCEARADYDADSAAKALSVTLGFLERELT
ncbi:MAG: dienelactone hydrolase family protein [Lysobacteraceae bacterium]